MIEPGKRYYIATPYTKYPSKEAVWKDACRVAATLKESFPDSFFYSPIAETYGIEVFGGLELTRQQSMDADKVHVDAADALIFVHLRGANNSKGMKMEVDWFKETGEPIMYLYPISILSNFSFEGQLEDVFYDEYEGEWGIFHPDLEKEF